MCVTYRWVGRGINWLTHYFGNTLPAPPNPVRFPRDSRRQARGKGLRGLSSGGGAQALLPGSSPGPPGTGSERRERLEDRKAGAARANVQRRSSAQTAQRARDGAAPATPKAMWLGVGPEHSLPPGVPPPRASPPRTAPRPRRALPTSPGGRGPKPGSPAPQRDSLRGDPWSPAPTCPSSSLYAGRSNK